MLTFNVFDATFEYDPQDPEPFRGGQNRFAPKQLGATVYELPPGQSVCPYHYESKEEWLIVLEGELTARNPEGETVLGPGDATVFPAGPAGAHRTDSSDPDDNVRVRRGQNLDYWDGELG
jgi:uncharacterized cupin superfamily protein